MENTEELPDLIPLDDLIDNLEFKFHVAHIAGTEPIDQGMFHSSINNV